MYTFVYIPESLSFFFLIQLLAVFRFKVLILAYAVCRLRHWWAIAVSMPGEWSPLQRWWPRPAHKRAELGARVASI